jgi:hypothetical protein
MDVESINNNISMSQQRERTEKLKGRGGRGGRGHNFKTVLAVLQILQPVTVNMMGVTMKSIIKHKM